MNASNAGIEIELRGAEAVWVLGAHLYATLVPLVLCLVADHHREFLEATVHDPWWLMVAAALLCLGSAFEVGQNTVDHWYLTPETGSANGTGVCDGLFYTFVTAGQAAILLALAGDRGWVVFVAALSVIAAPLLYLRQRAIFLPMGLTGLCGAWLAFELFGDPIVWLQLLLPAVTMYFFGLLLATGAQVLHGLTTAAASSGLWFLVLAIHQAEAGTPLGWGMVAAIIAATVIVGIAIRPWLARLPASPRTGMA